MAFLLNKNSVNEDSVNEDSENVNFVVVAGKRIGIGDKNFIPIICRIVGFEPGAFFFDLRPDGSTIIQRTLLYRAEKTWDDTAENNFIIKLGIRGGEVSI